VSDTAVSDTAAAEPMGAKAPAPGSDGAARRSRLRLPAEVALVGVTVGALVGLRPLFDSWSYLPPLIAVAVLAHLTVTGARVARRGLPVAGVLTVVAFAFTTTWLFERHSTWFGLPTAASWRAATGHLTAGWELFQQVVAPAEPTTGFLLATAVAVWLAVFVADWAAFRLWAPFEAVVPASGLVLFASILGDEDHGVGAAAVFLATVLAFLLLHRAYRQETTVRWVATGTGRGVRSLVATGAALAVVALVAGFVFAPRLPGADAPGLISLDGRGGGGGPRVTLSPLVDIRARLIDQRRTEVFTVRTEVPAYWRLTALDRFDGRIWSSGGTFEEAQGALPNGVSPDRASQQVVQQFDILALDAIWLPAAFEPSSIDAPRLDVRWEPASSTLIVDDDRATSDDTSYRVVSSIPQLQPADLRRAEPPTEEMVARYTALPDDFSTTARAEAEQVVAGAPTPYDQALALQGYFRDNFTYSTDVPAGHGEEAVDAFLARRVGFCEQFAGTFAAMARSIGLPSRVAVGFTQGERDAGDLGRYVVRGENAHAWPEVFLSGFGWVAFEPTPGRGAPGAESYTGVRPDQATSSGDELTVTRETTPTTASAGTVPQRPVASTVAPTQAGPSGGAASPWPARAATAFLVVLGAAVAYLLVVVGAMLARRAQWRVRAGRGPRERTRVAWLEANDALVVVGLVPDAAETPLEFSRRATQHLDTAGEAHRALALATTAADYAAEGVSVEVAEKAADDARTVVRGVRRRTTLGRRVLRRLGRGPRPEASGQASGQAPASGHSSRRKRSRMR